MGSGFWAGAVPPWAFVALVVLVILVIGGIALGSWYGYGRGFAHAEEEARWAREQAKARRTHPAYRQPPLSEWGPVGIDSAAAETWLAHEEQALSLVSSARQPAIDTGEIQAITDRGDAWMAKWIGDGHALSDG